MSEQKEVPATREQQVIAAAAKVTKRLEGDEVVIEIRVPAYNYSDRKIYDEANVGGGTLTS